MRLPFRLTTPTIVTVMLALFVCSAVSLGAYFVSSNEKSIPTVPVVVSTFTRTATSTETSTPKPSSTPTPAPTSTQTPTLVPTAIVYTVKEGDYLQAIAEQHCDGAVDPTTGSVVDAMTLYRMNLGVIKTPDYIEIGMVLVLPENCIP